MGACGSKGGTYKHKPISNSGISYQRPPKEGQVRMLVAALDYKQTDNPLSCCVDAENFVAMARASGVTDITIMKDEQCQTDAVNAAIRQVAARCEEDDYFVFFYAGHGTNLEDQSGDETDGQDEAFCFVDAQGQIAFETCMSDDVFAECVTESVGEGVRVLILTDCCHSGTIADLVKPCWDDIEAISIAGCQDSQTSGDTGTGGIFTHSMLMAIEKLQIHDESEYSVAKLFNGTLKFDDTVFASAQDITLQYSSKVPGPGAMAWPLTPDSDYVAPWTRAQQGDSSCVPSNVANAATGDADDVEPDDW